MNLATQLERELFATVQSLLDCSELNMDDMELSTIKTCRDAVALVTPIEEAQLLLDQHLEIVRRAVQCDNDASDAIDFISCFIAGWIGNQNKTITISVKGGVVTNVDNVPDGWSTEIDDQD